MLVALLVFAATYAAIAAGRVPFLSIDRPAAALIGAVLMVALGVLTPEQAAHGVNGDTLVLLFGTMVLTAYLAEAGFFRWASWHVLHAVGSPRALLWAVTLVSGVLSAFLVNDTVCVLVTPLVLELVDDAELPPLPYLLAVAFGANAGSAATLTGNPQNMIVGALSGIPYADFSADLALPALVALLAAAALLHLFFHRALPRHTTLPDVESPALDRALLAGTGAVLALVLAGFLAGLPMAWTALGGAGACIAIGGRPSRSAFVRVDWPLLVFFAGLFVVVAGIEQAGVAAAIHARAAPLLGVGPADQAVRFSVLTALASQVVSNVPYVLVAAKWIPGMADPHLAWLVVALASTLAGNLTIVGSVANLIVLESAGDRLRIGFWRFFAYGAPVTIVTTVLALAVLLARRGLLGG